MAANGSASNYIVWSSQWTMTRVVANLPSRGGLLLARNSKRKAPSSEVQMTKRDPTNSCWLKAERFRQVSRSYHFSWSNQRIARWQTACSSRSSSKMSPFIYRNIKPLLDLLDSLTNNQHILKIIRELRVSVSSRRNIHRSKCIERQTDWIPHLSTKRGQNVQGLLQKHALVGWRWWNSSRTRNLQP